MRPTLPKPPSIDQYPSLTWERRSKSATRPLPVPTARCMPPSSNRSAVSASPGHPARVTMHLVSYCRPDSQAGSTCVLQ